MHLLVGGEGARYLGPNGVKMELFGLETRRQTEILPRLETLPSQCFNAAELIISIGKIFWHVVDSYLLEESSGCIRGLDTGSS